MSPDAPIPFVPTEKARAALDEYAVVSVGDLVHIDGGKRLWTVEQFLHMERGAIHAKVHESFVTRYVDVRRLTVVAKERP